MRGEIYQNPPTSFQGFTRNEDRSRKTLILSVEERVTRRAKAIAEDRGTSVSRLVETFFTLLEQEEADVEIGRAQEPSEGPLPRAQDPHRLWATSRPTGHASGTGGFDPEEEETTSYPNAPSWTERVLMEEIERKHVS